jgi:hypothetical protein
MKIRREAIVAALVASLLVVGTAFAATPHLLPNLTGSSGGDDVESPEVSESTGAVSTAELTRVVSDLDAVGITSTADELAALAEKVGLGGAVRVLELAEASGKTADEIVAMFEGGMGWGQIARELGVDGNAGVGNVMSQGKAGGKPSPKH